MFRFTRNSHILNASFKYVNVYNAVYYCDKKIIVGTLEQVDEKKSSSKTTKADQPEELSRGFAKDEDIIQTVILEKEKDADVQSRLSKECDKLLNKKFSLSSSGLNLSIDTSVTTRHGTCWEDYTFAKTVENLKKTAATQTDICPKPVVTTVTTESGGGGDDNGSKITTKSNRPVRSEPGKVLLAFIPVEWVQFFVPKTGVTGFGTFLFTFGTFLVSKEYYVLEHNFYGGLSWIVLFWAGLKYVGPHVAGYLDKEIDQYEQGWERGREQQKNILNEQIEDEKFVQYQAEGQLMLVEAKRENVHLQLEEEFRLRQMKVYHEVVKRLNYHVAVADVHRKIFHRNLVEYVTKEVKKAITPDMEHKLFDVSVENLVSELERGDKDK